MMIIDERDNKCDELANIFENYLIMKNAFDYSEAKLKEDAPYEVKKAHKEYIKLKKEILKDRAKLPFI